LRYDRWGIVSDVVSSAAELYFLPGTVRFGVGGDYNLDWDKLPEIVLDLEIKPIGVTIYAKLSLADVQAALEISHIAFDEPALDPAENTAYLSRSLMGSRFIVAPISGNAGPSAQAM
jgi:hypothetical protein